MSLLPQELDRGITSATKDASPLTKAPGSQDKDSAKGGSKKGHDKGWKAGKGDATRESVSSTSSGRTALPPCLILPTLVDVIASGSSAYVSTILLQFLEHFSLVFLSSSTLVPFCGIVHFFCI